MLESATRSKARWYATVTDLNYLRAPNENDFVDLLRSLGATVFRMDSPADLLIGYAGKDRLAEVQSNDLRRGKRIGAKRADWNGAPVAILRTTDDVVSLLKTMEHT